MDNKCRKLIGCIMYTMLRSRPDLYNSMSTLSRYQNYGSEKLLLVLKSALHYIKVTVDLKLVYRKKLNAELVKGFVDADWRVILSTGNLQWDIAFRFTIVYFTLF